MEDNEYINITYGQLGEIIRSLEALTPLTGEGAPTSETKPYYLGQMYTDSLTEEVYICTKMEEDSGGEYEYTWTELTTA